MRLLFATTRGGGHVGPLVPFAGAAVAAGHDVLFAGPGSAERLVRRAALPFAAVGEPPAGCAATQARARADPHAIAIRESPVLTLAPASTSGTAAALRFRDATRAPDAALPRWGEAIAAEIRALPPVEDAVRVLESVTLAQAA